MSPGSATTQTMEGLWGTPGTVLTLNADGGTLDEGCSQTKFEPISPDSKGRFAAVGRLTTWGGGPQQGDAPLDAGRVIAVGGRIQGDHMTLHITGTGLAPREIVLQRGLRAKVVRCL
jgi:hypothetical protein